MLLLLAAISSCARGLTSHLAPVDAPVWPAQDAASSIPPDTAAPALDTGSPSVRDIDDGGETAVRNEDAPALALPAHLVLSAGSLPSFGVVALGQASGEATLAILNDGGQASGVISLLSSSADFVLQAGGATDCIPGTTVLVAGASCTLRVVFAPQSAGARSGFVSFSADPGGGHAIPVSGTGATAVLGASSSSLEFGVVTIGRRSQATSFDITNTGLATSGLLRMTVSSPELIVLGGEQGDCMADATVLAGSSCKVRVVFSPAQLGPRRGTLSFSAMPGGNVEVPVSGSGGCPDRQHDGGDHTCVAAGSCADGYHNDCTGACAANRNCQADHLSDGSGSCVPIAGVTWTQRLTPQRWTTVASSADGNRLAAAAGAGYIYTSDDAGATWVERESLRNWYAVASSSDGGRLVAVVNCGGAGNIYTSSDAGAGFAEHVLGNDWDAVASSADGAKLVAATDRSTLYTSTDFGATWTARGAPHDWIAVASSSNGDKLVAAAYGDSLYTSWDSGLTWQARESVRNWTGVASSVSGTELFAVAAGDRLYISTDDGQTWSPRATVQQWRAVAASADGSKLIAAVSGGYLYTSTDSGGTWLEREASRSWSAVASSADGTKLIAADWNGYVYTSAGPVP